VMCVLFCEKLCFFIVRQHDMFGNEIVFRDIDKEFCLFKQLDVKLFHTRYTLWIKHKHRCAVSLRDSK
jgi:hypothetical protein